MAEVVALKVRVRRGDDGQFNYPNFGLLPVVQAAGQRWQEYIDQQGAGWHYDAVSTMDDDDSDSPKNIMWAVALVPLVFAQQAVAGFSNRCSILTEDDASQFYNQRARRDEPDEIVNDRVMAAFTSQITLLEKLDPATPVGNTTAGARLTALKTKLANALDPDNTEPGVRRNNRKNWARFKARRGFTYATV